MSRDVAIIFGLKVLAVGLNALGLAALASASSVAAFGAFAALFSAGMLISIPAMAGLNLSLVRHTSGAGPGRLALARHGLGRLAGGLAAAGVLGGVVLLLAMREAAAGPLAALLFGLTYGFSEVLQSTARAFDGPVRAFVWREIAWRAAFFLTALAAALAGGLPAPAMLGLLTLALLLVTALQARLSALWPLRAPRVAEAGRLWRHAPGFMGVSLLSTAAQHLVVLLAGVTLSLEAAAYFFAALKVVQILSLSVVAVNFVLTTHLRDFRKGKTGETDTKTLTAICATAAWGNLLFWGAGMAALLVFGRLILSLFGAAYESGGVYLAILGVAAGLNAGTGPAGFVLVMFDRQRQFNLVSALAASGGAGLCLLLGGAFGLVGFCWGYVCWIGLQNTGAAWMAWRTLGINPTALARPDWRLLRR
ncbi:lipopolysaccharide biosynthesis protein [Pseudoroseicyclus tamaricis]|uniref:O-antigen/teichoic acid export membrane protein n=1 Tax=Pseudoroseicyclus tamaricis TaxID=2705421 RepID=A0A6B2JP70_9RHOB|nr:hypothetical protein [Pseudoroseicyclus tamaricis]NDU99867.1 hypothetical protein [Pseudoroseicyclus tamaricis]